MKDRQPEVGDVRVRSDGLPYNTVVEALSETGWVPLRGVISLEWKITAREFAELRIGVEMAIVDVAAHESSVMLTRYIRSEDGSEVIIDHNGKLVQTTYACEVKSL